MNENIPCVRPLLVSSLRLETSSISSILGIAKRPIPREGECGYHDTGTTIYTSLISHSCVQRMVWSPPLAASNEGVGDPEKMA